MRQSSILTVSLVLLASIVSSQCQANDPCRGVHCSYGAKCEVEYDRAKCVCPTVCIANEDPICGTDGNTYNNLCKLDVYNCETHSNVHPAYRGRCDQHIESSESCQGACPQNEDPVCGTDGNTYMNACKLAIANCENQSNVQQAYRGRC